MSKKKKWRSAFNPLRMMSQLTYLRFDELTELSHFIESNITRELKRWSEWADKQTNGLGKDEIDEFYEWHSEDYQKVDVNFRRQLRYSYVVTTYSIIESHLNDICMMGKHYREKQDKDLNLLGLHDLRGQGVRRARAYLEKVLLFTFPDEGKWGEITTLADVRNCIVHNEGIDSKDKLKSFVRHNTDLIKYGQRQQLEIESAYCTRILEKCRGFFKELYDLNMHTFNIVK